MAPQCKKCGKRRYTEDTAARAALSTSCTVGAPMRIYACPFFAGVYHITSEPKKGAEHGGG